MDALAARLRGQVLASDERQVRSLAFTALLLQLSAIYLLNAIHKDGVTWQQGTVVHYVLHQDRIVTWLGWWVRQHMTLGLSQALTWTALGLEWAIPLALLLPFRMQASRMLAVGLVFALHIGFGLFMNLGVFVPVMLAFAVHLLPSGFWSMLPAQRSLNRIGYKLLARHGVRLLTWSSALGLLRATTPTLRGSRSMLRERMMLVLMIYSAGQLFTDNRVFRHFGNWHQPGWSRMVTDYLQLHQGWGMFAPEAPTEDFNVVVDAVTEDGRHVDLFNEAASPGARAPGLVRRTSSAKIGCSAITS